MKRKKFSLKGTKKIKEVGISNEGFYEGMNELSNERHLIRYIKGWIETWRIMRNKELMESIRRAQKDVEEGRYRLLTHKEVFGKNRGK